MPDPKKQNDLEKLKNLKKGKEPKNKTWCGRSRRTTPLMFLVEMLRLKVSPNSLWW